MSKRVNNKPGNRAKRKHSYNHRTKCRAGTQGDKYATAQERKWGQFMQSISYLPDQLQQRLIAQRKVDFGNR